MFNEFHIRIILMTKILCWYIYMRQCWSVVSSCMYPWTSLIRRTTLLLLCINQLTKHPWNIHVTPPPWRQYTDNVFSYLSIFRAWIGAYWITVAKDNAELSSFSWWRHQMETFFAFLDLCAGHSPVTGEFLSQRPVSFDVFFDLRLNKRLNKQSRRWWFRTPSCSLWRHRSVCMKNMFINFFNCRWFERPPIYFDIHFQSIFYMLFFKIQYISSQGLSVLWLHPVLFRAKFHIMQEYPNFRHPGWCRSHICLFRYIIIQVLLYYGAKAYGHIIGSDNGLTSYVVFKFVCQNLKHFLSITKHFDVFA